MICRHTEKPLIMRSTPSLRSFPNVACETVPVFDALMPSSVLSREIVYCFLFKRVLAGEHYNNNNNNNKI